MLKNSEALKLVRTGLTQCVRCRWTSSAPNPTYFTNLAVLKRLAHAITAEGRLAELENRPGEAAEAYLNVIRLGYAISRGGLIIDSLVGIAVRAIGTLTWRGWPRNWMPNNAARPPPSLNPARSWREPTHAVLARERAWAVEPTVSRGRYAR